MQKPQQEECQEKWLFLLQIPSLSKFRRSTQFATVGADEPGISPSPEARERDGQTSSWDLIVHAIRCPSLSCEQVKRVPLTELVITPGHCAGAICDIASLATMP